MKTVNYNIRLDPHIKHRAEQTFSAFGMNLSEAINIFLHKAIMVQGLPFEVRELRPNERLREAMEEADRILEECKAGKRQTYATIAEMNAAMDAEDKAEGIDV